MESEIAQYNNYQIERKPFTAAEIKAQVQVIQQVMEAVMVKDVHYGTIPGTPKPTLYKPGSEKILTTFHIAAYPKEIDDLSTDDEIRYRVKVHGIAIDSGLLIGVGVGECSSSEEKYKWRRPVCEEEFNETPEYRKRVKWCKGYGDKPNYQQKQIRTNPADVANTILKMAKKRAQIDMTLTATAASDVFDQDLEDLPEGMAGEVEQKKPPVKTPQKKETASSSAITITIQEITEQTKTKDGAAMKNPKHHVISTDGNDYSTFDKKLADIAKSLVGMTAEITFENTKYGNDLKSIAPVMTEQREPGAEG